MTGTVLVLNAGSSSLKYQVVDLDRQGPVVRGVVDRADESGYGQAFERVTAVVREAGLTEHDLLAVGHRVVHGGDRFTGATLVDDSVLAAVEALSELAPLHNPPGLAGIRAAREAYPGLPQVAVFDTAWFASLPAAAATYAIDARLAERERIRRYGMHGISHQHVAREAARFLSRDPAELDLIVLHLGNGASAAAIRGGAPVDTSMGLTPLEGLVMGTRPGDLDPGVVVHLLRRGHTLDEVEDLLHHRSGLQGLSGLHDFRDLLAAVDSRDERAATAYQIYCHRLRKYVGAYLAVLGGADAIVFTAGVGEHVPRVREDSVRGLAALGVEVDPIRNRKETEVPRVISTAGSLVDVLVVPTDEELAIAREVRDLLA